MEFAQRIVEVTQKDWNQNKKKLLAAGLLHYEVL
jgi:hypothetical protein